MMIIIIIMCMIIYYQKFIRHDQLLVMICYDLHELSLVWIMMIPTMECSELAPAQGSSRGIMGGMVYVVYTYVL